MLTPSPHNPRTNHNLEHGENLDLGHLKKVVAYRRVSTKPQERDGVGLDAQQAAIDVYVAHHGYLVVGSYFEQSSGGGNVLGRNTQLVNAIKHARQHELPIIAYDVARIARDERSASRICRELGVTIISVREGGVQSPADLEARAAHAQVVLENLSKSTKEGVRRAMAAGKPVGNRTNLKTAQTTGTTNNQRAARAKFVEVARFVETLPDYELLTDRPLVLALNSAGILTRYGRQWTINGFRGWKKRVIQFLEDESISKLLEHPLWGRF
jgi:DNA invertase Pin-like site-specific DNA recombinase